MLSSIQTGLHNWSQGTALFSSKQLKDWNNDQWPVFESGVKTFKGALDEDDENIPDPEDDAVTEFNIAGLAGSEVNEEDEVVKEEETVKL